MVEPTLSRRQAVLGLSAVGVWLASGCASSDDASAPSTSTTSPADMATSGAVALSCTRTPEQMEGPFYLDMDGLRQDIREDRLGRTLALELLVVDADGCVPLVDVPVDIWHCDAVGAYSAYEASVGETFLRGTQVTDADGRATFTTIVPGWYEGRAVHIHVKAHPTETSEVTTQIYFDEDALDEVLATDPYASHVGTRVRHEQDALYLETDGPTPVELRAAADGVAATFVLGIATT